MHCKQRALTVQRQAAEIYSESCCNIEDIILWHVLSCTKIMGTHLRNLDALAAPSSGQYRAPSAILQAAMAASGASCQHSSSTLC